MEKKFKHEILEVCSLCDRVIHTDKDKWCSLIDFSGNDVTNKKFYHQFCFKDLIEGQGKVITKNFKEKVNSTIANLMKGINQQVGKNTDDKKEIIVEIK